MIALIVSIVVPGIVGGSGVFARLVSTPLYVVICTPLLMLLAWVANAGRVVLLLHANGRRIGFLHAWLVAAGGDFGAALGPGGITGIGAYVFLLARAGLNSATATGLFALEKLLDQTVFAAALAASAVALALYGHGPRPWGLFEIGFSLTLGVLVVVLLLIFQYRRVVGWIVWPLARLRVGVRRRRRFMRWSLRFKNSILAVAAMPRRRLALLALCAAGYWAPRFAILPLIAMGVGAHVPWGYLLAVQVLTLFAGQLSLLPGGAITVEAVFAALLLPWVDRQTVGVMLLVWRAGIFYFTLAVGGAGFLAATAWNPRTRAVPDAGRERA